MEHGPSFIHLYPDESFLAFHAIPYAEPPIGSKRFKHPISHSNWSEVYDASNADHKNKCCPQVNFSSQLHFEKYK